MSRNRWSKEISDFRDIVGSSVTDRKIIDLITMAEGNLQKALDLYFSMSAPSSKPSIIAIPDKPVSNENTSASRNRAPPRKALEIKSSKYLGFIEIAGTLTTRLIATDNFLEEGCSLDITMNAKISASNEPRNKKMKSIDSPLQLLVYGTPIVRFAQSRDISEVGRLPADISDFMYPLAYLHLIDFRLSVCSSGFSSKTLQPGASVPLRIEIYLTEFKQSDVTRSLGLSGVDWDSLNDRLRNCWRKLFFFLGILPIDAIEYKNPYEKESSETTNEDENDETEMTEAMRSLLGETFAKLDLPKLNIPKSIFKTNLKEYQSQALYWMACRESPPGMGGLSREIEALVDTGDSNKIDEEVVSDIPKVPVGWSQYFAADGSIFYMHDATNEISLETPSSSSTHGTVLGGILADDMGLGKTVMTLSLIALDRIQISSASNNWYNERKSSIKATGKTLIVVPLSLMRQWKTEAELHCEMEAFEYYGTSRSRDPSILSTSELVLTTYGTLSIEGESSPLCNILWNRVVLDEAHYIKNRSTKANKIVKLLQCKSKWCLSGTPMQNGLADIYPLISWLGVQPYSSYAYFQRNILTPLEGADKEHASIAIQKMLKPIMIRRTKSTRSANGEPLLVLPARNLKTIWLELTAAEEDFYTALFWKTRLQFDQFVQNNSVMMHYTNVLQLIMRLRQALCHPLLCIKGKELDVKAISDTKDDSVESLVARFLDSQKVSEEYAKSLLKNLSEDKECPICVDTMHIALLTPCGHLMCKGCLLDAVQSTGGLCPLCRASVSSSETVEILCDPKSSTRPDRGLPVPSSKMMALLKFLKRDVIVNGRKVIVFSQFVSFLDMIADMLLVDDSKIPFRKLNGTHSMDQRRLTVDWLREANDVPVRSDPDAAPDSEIDTDDDVSNKKQGKVLLVSLKAGGVGLNLVAASVIYMLDLWWNPAVEDQAFQRVHRIGQTRKVRAYKFVVKDSMDSKILDLQNRKSAMIGKALGDRDTDLNSLSSKNALSLDDLKHLFKPRDR